MHLTAAAPIDCLIELTYDPIVYYSERENIFMVSLNGSPKPGFINCNEMRNFRASAEEYDNFLKTKILLNKEEFAS